MVSFKNPMAAVMLACAGIAGAAVAAPAAAAINTQDPAQFVDTLADQGFAVLRTGNKTAAKAQFRTLLSQHFAVDQIGDRLIRRWRNQITPAQYATYKAAFPQYIIGMYTDQLFAYSSADLKVVRAVPRGNSAAVLTQVAKPGTQPIAAVWTVDKIGGGYKVSNLTVGGVNLSLTQAQTFDSFVQRNGFDALVKFMKSRG